MIAQLNNHVFWYVSRSSGIVTWLLCGASIIWGLALSTRALGKNPTPAWLLDLHRWLGSLALVFTAIHILGVVGDGWLKDPIKHIAFSHYGWREILIPYARKKSFWYRPTAVAWGIVALYLLLAIQVTSWLRSKMPKRVWHTIHLLSFPLFVISCMHSWQNGTDVKNRALLWSAVFMFMMVFGFTFMRLITLKNVESQDRAASLAAVKAARASAAATASGDAPVARAPRVPRVATTDATVAPAHVTEPSDAAPAAETVAAVAHSMAPTLPDPTASAPIVDVPSGPPSELVS